MTLQAFSVHAITAEYVSLELLQLWAKVTWPGWNSNDKEETHACLE